MASYAFGLYAYGDFSGYSDIARGTARLLGFDLMLNFNLPYYTESLRDFWRQWHISLSSWLRDYLYIPLGGNRSPIPCATSGSPWSSAASGTAPAGTTSCSASTTEACSCSIA